MLVDLILFFIRLDPAAFLLTHNNQSIFLREIFRAQPDINLTTDTILTVIYNSGVFIRLTDI